MAKKTTKTTGTKRAASTGLARETVKPVKEELFDNFYSTASTAFTELERLFGIKGLCPQLFGLEYPGHNTEDEHDCKERLRSTYAWTLLSNLYDYAVDGLDRDGEAMSLVLDGSLALSLIHSDEGHVSQKWQDIVAMADGRYGLDEGVSVDHYKVALLANVDLRTVRNAISAGEMSTFKQDDYIFVENASARFWLHSRKGFRSTVLQGTSHAGNLIDVQTPSQFGAFLSARRQELALDDADGKLVIRHPNVTPADMERVESGVFKLPLDAVVPLADFYQVGRKAFLETVMRIFFSAELSLLQDK